MAFGLLGPLGPALIVSVMIVAAATVHWQHGLFAQNNGIEVPLLYGVGRVGAGADRLRRVLARRRCSALTWPEPVIWAALALGVHRRIREPRDPQDRDRPRRTSKTTKTRSELRRSRKILIFVVWRFVIFVFVVASIMSRVLA